MLRYLNIMVVLLLACTSSEDQLRDAAVVDADTDAADTDAGTADADAGGQGVCVIGSGSVCPNIPQCCAIYAGRKIRSSTTEECGYPVSDGVEVIGCSSIACGGSNALGSCYEIPEDADTTVTYCSGSQWNVEVLRDGAVMRNYDEVSTLRASLPVCE